MNSEEPIGIIELNNNNIKCLIFRIKSDNKVEILSSSISVSEGVHNDAIANITKASNAIRACISETEKKAKVSLKKINVVLEQPDFLCTKFSKHKKIDGSKIDKDDIEFLLKEAKKQLIHNDKDHSIIHIFNQNYIVDGK
jgi:cell division ATPase FtsA